MNFSLFIGVQFVMFDFLQTRFRAELRHCRKLTTRQGVIFCFKVKRVVEIKVQTSIRSTGMSLNTGRTLRLKTAENGNGL